MDELQTNYQFAYFHPQNSLGVSVNMITFGCEQFASTVMFKQLDVLKKVCSDIKPGSPPDFNMLKDFAFNNLTDSIKITIFFENFIKALLLANGFLVHKLDKTIFPVLYTEQFKRPIAFSEIKAVSNWEINTSIKTPIESLKYQIKGINKFTIGMKELLGRGYLSPLEINSDLIKLLEPYFQRRNDLHYYTSESFSVGSTTHKDFTKIVDFINDHVVRVQNLIADKLSFPNEKRLPRFKYNL